MSLLTLKAGHHALEVIRDGGFRQESIKTVTGAAGGPKWIVLGGLDRYLFGEFFKERQDPLFLVGSSIAAWRFAAAARRDPLAALEKFRDAYFSQRYSDAPGAAEVTRESRRIMNLYLEDTGAGEILEHPFLRLSVMAARSRLLLSSDQKRYLLPGLASAAAFNLFSRRSLRFFFSRALFYDQRDLPPFYSMSQFPIERIPLGGENLLESILASGSIPLAMEGIRDIPGARKGTYRDGGMIDYQMDIPYNAAHHEIVLFPHYTDRIIPGWFDKNIFWHRPSREHTAGVLLAAPSKKFLEHLPEGKVPDRHDFRYYAGRDSERISAWEYAFSMSLRMADEFIEAVESGNIRNLVEPL